MFNKIFYNFSAVTLPHFLKTLSNNPINNTYFQRQTRTYNDNDRLKIKSTITPRVNAFQNSFFYRSHIFWNSIPLEIRSVENTELFKIKLEQHLWLIAENNLNTN